MAKAVLVHQPPAGASPPAAAAVALLLGACGDGDAGCERLAVVDAERLCVALPLPLPLALGDGDSGETLADGVTEALAAGDAVPDGDSEVVAGERGDVPDTVMLAHLKAPAFAVAPSPTIAPQKFALSSAAAGIVLLPDCGDVVIASEKTALEEKLDVALPADE